MRKVAVIGVGQTKFGDHPNLGAGELFAQAFTDAVADVDKGFDTKLIQEAYVGTLGVGGGQLGNFAAVVGEAAKITGIPITRVENACASSGFAFRSAFLAIASGVCDAALAAGVEKMRDLPPDRLRYWLGVSGDTEWERLAGMTFAGVYALMAQRHIHQYGTKEEHLHMVAVKNHKYGADNPKAQLQRAITLDQANNSATVCHPLRLFDCCPTSDGASAAILCDAEIASKFTDTPVRILGVGAGTDRLALFQREDFATLKATIHAAKQAYQMAHLEAKDINLAEVHDCFTIAEIMAYEDLGFCKKGEGGRFIEEEQTYIGGRIPVNASGGLKAKGHPIGATWVGQIYEITNQLRGKVEKKARQIANAKFGLAHNVGGSGATATVHILGV
ncbi:MAG TPA: thiolase domain-containing protein [Candidatus Acidoferrales bacterium]|nr:thiolase domain-containing protein [Candidatus Acidoferrales bacterium]